MQDLNITGYVPPPPGAETYLGFDELVSTPPRLTPTESIEGYTSIYMTSFWVVMGATLLLLSLVPLLKKWTHGVK